MFMSPIYDESVFVSEELLFLHGVSLLRVVVTSQKSNLSLLMEVVDYSS